MINFISDVLVLLVLIFGFIFLIWFLSWVFAKISTFKFHFSFSRGFESLSSLKNIEYYRGVKKEEMNGWDTLEVSHRKLVH